MKVVKVLWVDSCNSNMNWTVAENIEIEPMYIDSFGVVVKDTDEFLAIAQNYGDNPEQYSNITTIPKCCIKEIFVIHENNVCEKEQKPTDKIEPKFKVGDWITDGYLHCKITDVLDDRYIVDTKFGKRSAIPFKRENNYHLWSIQDAKSGDILAESKDGVILIFRGISNAKWNDVIDYHCHYNCNLEEFIIKKDLKFLGNVDDTQLKPATKIQRDLLFQKMKEAGYEWDAEKKELKKITQNSVDYSFKAKDWYVSKVDGKIRNIYYSVDNVEPKFKVGDWVVQENIGVYKVIEVCESWYEVVDNKDKHYSIGFDKEYMCHLWTIQDAKDGDVLAFDNDTIVMFKDLYSSTTFHSYCHIEDGVFDISKDEMPDWWEGKGFYPATKKQCDLLFAKMKEAGYEWDAEKKELKKINTYCQENCKGFQETGRCFADGECKAKKEYIEQKHNEWGEEDERERKRVVGLLEGWLSTFKETNYAEDCKRGIEWLKSLNGKIQPQQEWSEEDNLQLQAAVDICKSSGHTITSDWLKSLKDRVQPKQEWSEEDEKKRNLLISILEVNHPNGYFKVNPINTANMEAMSAEELVNWLKSLNGKIQPKQEWSKNDITRINEIIETLNIVQANRVRTQRMHYSKATIDKNIDWLKSLKDIVQLKQEWSEEDIHNIEDIDSVLFYDKDLPEDTCVRLRNWLNSIKPQNHWKPTEAQLASLTIACDRNDRIGFDLTELLKDLKKL